MPRVCWEEQLCVSCEFVTVNSRCMDFLRSTGLVPISRNRFGMRCYYAPNVPCFEAHRKTTIGKRHRKMQTCLSLCRHGGTLTVEMSKQHS